MQHGATLQSPPTLKALAHNQPIALFLDFDGTLVEIAATPETIAVPAGLAQGLVDLSHELEGRLALVSGRALDDITCQVGRLDIARAGSHYRARPELEEAILEEAQRLARSFGLGH